MHDYLKNACLLTDFYQFTMAQACFENRRQDVQAVFHLFFRKNPFNGNWAIAAGLGDALDLVERFKFDDDSLNYLASLRVFSQEFLSFLKTMTVKIDIFGVNDGELIFPFEPILRVSGPLILCQLLETPILNIVNFQTLIATKAMRMVEAAGGKDVVDFGLRRAQGFDGAISATKAGFIGGIAATSNVWAAKHFGIPPSGTQAHSFIMSYKSQSQAFSDFARTIKHNCSLVIDTYDPITGIDDAIKTFLGLGQEALATMAIRIDSGDLLSLSKLARLLLDRAGLRSCKIIASGDLDEYQILKLEGDAAPIDIYGVGTRLLTGYEDPALSGVYKLAAVNENGIWRDTCKGSADKAKESWPGHQAITRFFQKGQAIFDQVFDPTLGPRDRLLESKNADHELLLHQKLMSGGKISAKKRSLPEIRAYAARSLKLLPEHIRSLKKASSLYPVYFDSALRRKKLELTDH